MYLFYSLRIQPSNQPRSYRDYRGLKKLINVIESSQKNYDVHTSDISLSVQLFSSIGEPRSSEDPHADERSLESSSGKTLSVEPLGPELDHRICVSVPVELDPRHSLQACLYDTSSKSGLCRGLSSSRCEPRSYKFSYIDHNQ